MITNEQRHDMALRYVKRDKEYFEKYADLIKTAKIQINLFNILLDNLHQDFHNHQRLLTLNKIQVGKWKRVDDAHIDYRYMFNGVERALKYNNEQLKNEDENMLIQRL